jgi:hypothetical protein
MNDTPPPLTLELARAYCLGNHPSRTEGGIFHPKGETCETALHLMAATVAVLNREQTDRIMDLLPGTEFDERIKAALSEKAGPGKGLRRKGVTLFESSDGVAEFDRTTGRPMTPED